MWFGDLVTMAWWDDLWLKESFATWASSFAVSEGAEDPAQPWAAFGSSSKTLAYRQDQLPSTHPVSADIVDLEAIEYNFDQITYAKGASVLVQLVAYVGREAFLSGVRAYFAKHAYGNTTLADLLGPLEQASGRDLSQWSAQWLETAGVNTLRLALDTDDQGAIRAGWVEQTATEHWPTLRHAPDRARPLRPGSASSWSGSGASRPTSPGRVRRCPSWPACAGRTRSCSTTTT